MLAIMVDRPDGPTVQHPSAAELTALLRGLPAAAEGWLVVRRIPGAPDADVRVRYGAGGYGVEFRAGRAVLGGPEEVVALLTAWAAGAPDWDAGVAWSTAGGPEPVPPLDLPEDDHRSLVERVRVSIAGGYEDREDIAEIAEEHLYADGASPVSPEQAEALVDRMWAQRLAEQAHWEGETDPERLTRAFDALEEAGLTAREHFTCCRTCGNAEIGGEAEEDSRGFVYFHTQGTDAAAAGHGLTLYYGGFDDSAATTTAVGHEVTAALTAAGLPVEWDGDPARAIKVTPLDWRKRLEE